MMHQTVLRIEGMMCQKSCVTTIQNALLGVTGVDRAEAVAEERVTSFRDFEITPNIENKFGLQVGCPGCDAYTQRARRRHIPSCRERNEDQMLKVEPMKHRIIEGNNPLQGTAGGRRRG